MLQRSANRTQHGRISAGWRIPCTSLSGGRLAEVGLLGAESPWEGFANLDFEIHNCLHMYHEARLYIAIATYQRPKTKRHLQLHRGFTLRSQYSTVWVSYQSGDTVSRS